MADEETSERRVAARRLLRVQSAFADPPTYTLLCCFPSCLSPFVCARVFLLTKREHVRNNVRPLQERDGIDRGGFEGRMLRSNAVVVIPAALCDHT